MRIFVDFDGTIVDDSHAYDDLRSPLTFLPGARWALLSLKAAGHTLVLFSGRASPRLLYGEESDGTLVLDDGFRRLLSQDPGKADAQMFLNQQRYRQMLDFVEHELPGVFSAVTADKGGADLFVDDKAMRYGGSQGGHTWLMLRQWFGTEVPGNGGGHGEGQGKAAS